MTTTEQREAIERRRQTVKQAAIEARSLLAQLPCDTLAQVWCQIVGAVTFKEWPRLTVRWNDFDEVHELVCPYCLGVADEDSLYAVDVAERWTHVDPENISFEKKLVSFWYDGHGDYEGLAYLHDCGEVGVGVAFVRLPEGWEENS